MPHRRHELCDQVSSVFANDGGTDNPVLPRYGQHLHETVSVFVGDGPIEFVNPVDRHLVGHPLLARFQLVQPHPGHFRVGERCPGDHTVVDTKLLEGAKQGVHRSKPRLMRRHVGKLIRAGHIPDGKDVGILGTKETIYVYRTVRPQLDTNFLKAVSVHVGCPPDGDQQLIKFDLDLVFADLAQQRLGAIDKLKGLGPMANPYVHPLVPEALRHQLGYLLIFPDQEPRQHLDLGHPATETTETLREFTPDWPPAENNQPVG